MMGGRKLKSSCKGYLTLGKTTKQQQPVQYGLLEQLHPVPVRLWFETCLTNGNRR